MVEAEKPKLFTQEENEAVSEECCCSRSCGGSPFTPFYRDELEKLDLGERLTRISEMEGQSAQEKEGIPLTTVEKGDECP